MNPEADPLQLDVSAGGVVVRAGADGPLVALAEQEDRNRGGLGVRLPKGHLDPGESAEEAALREVLEETGLEARILRPLQAVRYRYTEQRTGAHVHKEVRFFLMAWVAGEIRAADGEFERAFWAPLADAPARMRFETERDVLEEAREHLRREPLPVR